MTNTGNPLAVAMVKLAEVKLMADVEQLADFFDCREVFDFVKTNNPSADLPYHNNQHQFLVALTTWRLLSAAPWHIPLYDVSDLPMYAKELFIAALFHDYNHTGGREADSVNVMRALDAMWDWSKANDPNQSEFDPDLVANLIMATEFPWKDHQYDEDGFDDMRDILRDADILASAEIAGFSMPITGLPVELVHKLGKILSPTEMVAGQHDFMTKLQLHTEPGKVMWAKLYPHILNAQQAFAEEMNRTNTRVW